MKPPNYLLLCCRGRLRAVRLQNYWKKLCEDEKRSRDRNDQLLREFDRVEAHLSNMAAQTDRLRQMKVREVQLPVLLVLVENQALHLSSAHHLYRLGTSLDVVHTLVAALCQSFPTCGTAEIANIGNGNAMLFSLPVQAYWQMNFSNINIITFLLRFHFSNSYKYFWQREMKIFKCTMGIIHWDVVISVDKH